MPTFRRPGVFRGRTAVARAVCDGLDLVNALGRPQVSGCMAALVTLEAEGIIQLPPEGPGGGVSRAPVMQAGEWHSDRPTVLSVIF